MPDIEITIGDRRFFVSCREGEEHFLHAAAKMLDAEASPLQDQMGRLPEARMLLMAGLMLADRTASLEDDLRQAEEQIAALKARQEASAAQTPPADYLASLERIAAEAESLAAEIEARRP